MIAEVGKKYRHYKGNEYVVVAIARNSEDIKELFVIYQDLSDPSKIWARPRPMFEEKVELDGRLTERFTLLN